MNLGNGNVISKIDNNNKYEKQQAPTENTYGWNYISHMKQSWVCIFFIYLFCYSIKTRNMIFDI